jgi:hypothetical protein
MKTGTEIAAEVVRHLDGWELVQRDERYSHFATIRRAEGDYAGAEITFSVSSHGADAGRCSIGAVWPRLSNGQHYTPRKDEVRRISVNGERSSVEIAREVQRRLLPAYLPAYSRAVSYLAACAAEEDAAKRVLATLASILGEEVATTRRSGEHRLYSSRRERGSATIEVFSGSEMSVTMRLHSLTPALAERVARVLATTD